MSEIKDNYCCHCGKNFENSKQFNNHLNQLGEEYLGAIDRTFDDDLEKLR